MAQSRNGDADSSPVEATPSVALVRRAAGRTGGPVTRGLLKRAFLDLAWTRRALLDQIITGQIDASPAERIAAYRLVLQLAGAFDAAAPAAPVDPSVLESLSVEELERIRAGDAVADVLGERALPPAATTVDSTDAWRNAHEDFTLRQVD